MDLLFENLSSSNNDKCKKLLLIKCSYWKTTARSWSDILRPQPQLIHGTFSILSAKLLRSFGE